MKWFLSKLHFSALRLSPIIIGLIGLIFSFMLLPGCSMIPDMATSEAPIPGHYPKGQAYDEAITELKKANQDDFLHTISWQQYYKDKTLKDLIKTGLENNSDLKVAALRILEAQALYGIEKSALLPDLNAEGSFVREKSNRANFSASSQASIYENYQVNLGMTSYEIDFFGRIRSLKKAAINTYLSTVSAHKAARIALIGEIAVAYNSLRTNQALLALTEQTLNAHQESFDIIKKRAEEGVSDELELAQAETLLHAARVNLYQYIDAVAKDKSALRILMGTPNDLPELPATQTDVLPLHITRDVPIGLPSLLLTVRPDIVSAEYALRSANADIGAARAAFFPRISLTTFAGYASADFSKLFESSSQAWQFSPQISAPIFNGRLSNSLKLAEIRKDIAVVEYEKTIEAAFRDVSNALSTIGTANRRIQAQNNFLKATKRSADLSEKRYEAGIENYLAVLDAKRQLYREQQELIIEKAQKINGKIALYKALGGGGNDSSEL